MTCPLRAICSLMTATVLASRRPEWSFSDVAYHLEAQEAGGERHPSASRTWLKATAEQMIVRVMNINGMALTISPEPGKKYLKQ